MNTVGKKIAQERHRYMEDFAQFYAEWEGKNKIVSALHNPCATNKTNISCIEMPFLAFR
jgi:hypothetical protein